MSTVLSQLSILYLVGRFRNISGISDPKGNSSFSSIVFLFFSQILIFWKVHCVTLNFHLSWFEAFIMDQTSLGKVFTQLKHLPLNERIAAYYSYLKDSDRLPQVQRAPVKSAINAAALKIAGDQCFLRLDFVEALKFYTRSVAAAPPGSTELAMAYAVRSVVLLKLDRKKACLVDVNRALKEDCPKITRQKLRARKRELSVKIQENDREVLRLMVST